MTDGELSEDDVGVKLITPAIVAAGWDEATQIRRQVFFTKGRITQAPTTMAGQASPGCAMRVSADTLDATSPSTVTA